MVIHTQNGVFNVYERLVKLRSQLPEGFIQCHQSFVVNMRHIRRFLPQDILLDTDVRVPVSRSKYVQTGSLPVGGPASDPGYQCGF